MFYDFESMGTNFLWNALNYSFVFLAGVLGPLYLDLFGGYSAYWGQAVGELKFDKSNKSI